MTLVSTRERENAAHTLRRHFLSGRLTPDEFGERVRQALQARHAGDLRAALAGLPPVWRDADELRRIGYVAKRSLVVATASLLWLLVTAVLLVAFAASAITHGLTTADLVGYPVAWLLVTAIAWRAARRP